MAFVVTSWQNSYIWQIQQLERWEREKKKATGNPGRPGIDSTRNRGAKGSEQKMITNDTITLCFHPGQDWIERDWRFQDCHSQVTGEFEVKFRHLWWKDADSPLAIFRLCLCQTKLESRTHPYRRNPAIPQSCNSAIPWSPLELCFLLEPTSRWTASCAR